MSEDDALASAPGQHNDRLNVELVEPDGMPVMVRIVDWPSKPSVVHPHKIP